MRVWRVVFAQYAGSRDAAFSGAGGLLAGGRWHPKGRRVVYASEHLSLAALELLVHLQRSTRIRPCVSYTVRIPNAQVTIPAQLPSDWRTNASATRDFGETWLSAMTGPVLRVPSVVVPQEFNFVLNPAHPAFTASWVEAGPEPFVYDPRLTRP